VYTGNYSICINPRVTHREGAVVDDEGCLSREGWIAKVERSEKITFQAYDLDMIKLEKTVEGIEARCVLHEIDHLDGILFTDRAKEGTLRKIEYEDEEEPGDSDEDLESSIGVTGEVTGGVD